MRKLPPALTIAIVGSLAGLAGVFTGARVFRPVTATPAVSANASDGEAALQHVLDEVDLEGVPFDEAVEKVRRLSGANIIADWPELANRTNPRVRIWFHARRVTLDQALSAIVGACPGAGYAPSGDRIIVSGHDALISKNISARAYDVHDLIAAAPAGRSGSPVPRARYWSAGTPDEYDIDRLPTPEQFVTLMKDEVDPDSWISGSIGNVASYRFFDGKIILVAGWQGHREMTDLLARLRLRVNHAPVRVAPSPYRWRWDSRLGRSVCDDPELGDAALRRRVAEVSLDEVPLDLAVASLGKMYATNVVVDWPAPGTDLVDRRSPVTLHLRDVTLAEALRAMCLSTPIGLDFAPDGGYVRLAPAQGRPLTVTRVYDLRDWVARKVPDDSPPSPAPSGPYEPSVSTMISNRRTAELERLADLICHCINPDTWEPFGGGFGSATAACDQLVVSNTWEVQEKVRSLLDALRAQDTNVEPTPPGIAAAVPVEPAGAAELALRAHLPIVKAQGRLEEIVATLRHLSRANIVVDEAALNLAGSERAGLSLDLKNVALHEALADLVSQLSAGSGQPVPPFTTTAPPPPPTIYGFCPHGDYIIVGCFDLRFCGSMMSTCVYDVKDLMPPVPAEEADPEPASLPGHEPPDADRLAHLVHEVLGLGDWNVTADPLAQCVLSYDGRLVVTQTWENQRKLADRLAAQRAKAAKTAASLVPDAPAAPPVSPPGPGPQP